MTAEDDDRTVIRPPGGALPGGDAMAPADNDRTLIGGQKQVFPVTADMGNGLPVGTMLGEFELTSVVGEGGFGIVYLAYDRSLERRVALKEYMPSVLAARAGSSQVQVKSERHRETFEAGRKSFINEAKLLAQFDHPSLVKVYRFWEANGTAYMVMPFYEGRTLKDQLKQMGGPPDEAWLRNTLLNPLTEALAVIHREQCYHRDIAPDNVMMLAGSNRPLLLDFGAARRVIGDMTQALTVILKPGYAPVEQYAEIPGMKQGPWTDVYALAAVVHFAIVGKTPPPSVGRLLNDTYVPLVQAMAGRYSDTFLRAIDRALTVRPEERTQSIAQFRQEMGLDRDTPAAALPSSFSLAAAPRAVAGLSPASPLTANSGAAPLPRKTALLASGAAAVAVAALAWGAYSWLSPAPRAVAGSDPAAAAPPAAITPAATPATDGAPGPVFAAPAQAQTAAIAAISTFDVSAEFERVVQAQTPGFGVQAQAAQSTLRIDQDELRFSVQAERDGFLYVQAYAADGSLMLLYPNAVAGAQRVRKGQTLKLPQLPIVFTAAEPAGPNLLLLMVSARERDLSELQPRKAGHFRMLPTGADAQRILGSLPARKVPALAGKVICAGAGAVAGAGTSSCDDEYGATLLRLEIVR
jgi:hypothetical protein